MAAIFFNSYDFWEHTEIFVCFLSFFLLLIPEEGTFLLSCLSYLFSSISMLPLSGFPNSGKYASAKLGHFLTSSCVLFLHDWLPEFRGLYSCCPCLSEMNQNPEGELLSLLKPKIIACHLLCSHVAEEFITLVLSNLYHGVRLIADAKEAMECLPCLSLSPSNLRQIHLTSKSIGLFFSAKQYQDSDRFDDKLMKPVNRSVSTEVDCVRGSAAACVGGNEWYLFSLRDLKYATGQRTNRATMSGYWKATGKDKPVTRKGLLVGMRKTLVFYQGRAPKGKKTKWVMHEFRMEGSDGAPKLPFKVALWSQFS